MSLLTACLLASLSDETPEGKSIVELGREIGGTDAESSDGRCPDDSSLRLKPNVRVLIWHDGTQIRKGAFDAIRKITEAAGNNFPKEMEEVIGEISGNGGTPLVVCVNRKVAGVIELQDIIKPGIQ